MSRVRHRFRLGSLLLALSAPALLQAAELHFAPLEFLLGHCWRAPFPDKKSDVQCYEPLYGGELVKNTHVVVGSEPQYEGRRSSVCRRANGGWYGIPTATATGMHTARNSVAATGG